MSNNTYDLLKNNLENLGFSTLEANIYLELLSGAKMSAYQLAKKIDIARASIYNALEHMLDKGMVYCVPNKTPMYTACEPKLLLHKLKENMNQNISSVSSMLEEFEKSRVTEEILMLRGFIDIVIKAKDILEHATNDIYINTDIDLKIFREEFLNLKKRGIKIVVFSFYDIDQGGDFVDFYTHGRIKEDDYLESRFMLAEYDHISLTAGRNSKYDEWTGIISNVPLNVRILEEHIHNDIYMLKLRDEYGKEIYNKIQVSTEFEQENLLRR